MTSFIMRRAEALAECQQTMTKVYGEWTKEKAAEWRPKPYADNKSRYLWTDAFGVCNFVSLAKETGLAHYLDQADALIRDVHDTLGRDRHGKRLPNATDAQPLNGGLRIGKVHDEDHPDGDGQYFHYLTKWAFALNCMSVARNEKRYNDLAVQLIKAIHPRFLFTMNAMRPRLSWKMSIDLSRPLVPSEGNLDPYDGYVTYRLVQQTNGDASILKSEIEDMRRIVAAKWERYSSSDPLDLGEALWLTHWFPQEDWATHIARRSLHSLESLFELDMLLHHSHRLAFREFGTALGLRVHPVAQTSEWQRRVDKLLAEWAPEVWTHDADITPVMYCAALLPGVWRRDDAAKA